MNFELTEERQMLQDSLRRFLSGTVNPANVAAATDSRQGFDPHLWEGLIELGVPAMLFAENQGGFGGSGFDIMVVFEELGRAGLPTPLLETALLAGTLHNILAPDLSVESMMTGAIATLAHGEPSSRFDLAHVDARATATQAGYRLSGCKAVVHHAQAASLIFVTARIFGEALDKGGLCVFSLSPDDVQMRDYPLNGGGRAAEVSFDLEVPKAALIGPEGGAFDAIETAHARAVAAQCAEALGLMEAIKALTVDYLRQRKQFGQPIGKFQALQHRMADVLIEIEQARSAVINLCGHLESERSTRELHVSATKNLIGRVAKLVVEESIQMHGGIGMTQDYALGHLAKRLMMVDHRFGDADFHLERFVRLSAA